MLAHGSLFHLTHVYAICW